MAQTASHAEVTGDDGALNSSNIVITPAAGDVVVVVIIKGRQRINSKNSGPTGNGRRIR